MSATPPKVIAALVVTLPMMALSGGQANDATPRTKRATPTQTVLLRLESFAPSSRAVSFWAAPSSVWARVSSRSVRRTGVVEYWSGGARRTGVVEYWSAGARGTGVVEYWSAGVLGTEYVRVLMVS